MMGYGSGKGHIAIHKQQVGSSGFQGFIDELPAKLGEYAPALINERNGGLFVTGKLILQKEGK